MERESRVRNWAQHIEAWKSSGLSQRAYCAREGIAVSTLQWWWRRLRENGRVDTPKFVPVALREITDLRDEPIEVVLLSGRRLRLAAPRDETELARLVRLLEVLPC
jgi:transposase-like protein